LIPLISGSCDERSYTSLSVAALDCIVFVWPSSPARFALQYTKILWVSEYAVRFRFGGVFRVPSPLQNLPNVGWSIIPATRVRTPPGSLSRSAQWITVLHFLHLLYT
jgi:hypothetical protein